MSYMTEPKTPVSIRLTEKETEGLDRIADIEDRTRSYIARRAIVEYLDKYERRERQ